MAYPGRGRLAARRRQRRQREQAKQFTVVAIKSRTPFSWDQWGDLSTQNQSGQDEIVDGLGGKWLLSPGKKSNDAKASTRAGLHASTAKIRSPKKLGALNELEIVAGDTIRVIGACNPDGTKCRPVESSSEWRRPRHDATGESDETTWWVGTLITSGRVRPSTGSSAGVLGGGDGTGGAGFNQGGSVYGTGARGGGAAMGWWPPSDTRQRTGRFPQSVVVLSSKQFGGTKSGGTRQAKTSQERTFLQGNVVFGCNMCDQKIVVNPSASQEPDRFSSSFDLLKKFDAGDGVFVERGLDSARREPYDICHTCSQKLAAVIKSMARRLLLKPTVGMMRKSLEAVVNLNKSTPNEENLFKLRRNEPVLDRTHDSLSMCTPPYKPSSATGWTTNFFHDSKSGDDYIIAMVGHGEIGIEFNNEGEVKLIKHGMAGHKIRGLCKGDLLVSIGQTSVKNKTMNEIFEILTRHERPVKLKFLRHKEWSRGPNGLPEIDFHLVEKLFETHDQHHLGSLTDKQFAAFMSEVHELSCIMQGKEVDNDYYPIKFAQRLIDAHDTDDDGVLSFDELIQWIDREMERSQEERHSRADRGDLWASSNQFLEDVAIALQLEENDPDCDETWKSGVVRRSFTDMYSDRERLELTMAEDCHEPLPNRTYFCLIFQGGSDEPMGIDFDHAGVVNSIIPGSQASKMKQLTRGDVLDAIGTVSVRGMTFEEMKPILRSEQNKVSLTSNSEPYVLTFEEHMDWEREDSGLPCIDFKKLERVVKKYDPDETGLDVENFSSLWIDIHDRARKARGQKKLGHSETADDDRPFDPREYAQQLIYAHGKDESGQLQANELISWISKESSLSAGERAVIAMRGGYCSAEVQFVNDCAFGLPLKLKSQKQIAHSRKQRSERRAMVARRIGASDVNLAGDIILQEACK